MKKNKSGATLTQESAKKSSGKKIPSPRKNFSDVEVEKNFAEKSAPKVSVILSSYNHEKYIAQAIQSVLDQTFTDFELLIFDDGSTDNSREIIKTFSDPRIKTFLYEVNRGPRIASQECIQAAGGKYIAVHHSDDLWRKDKLEKQVEFLEKNPDYSACLTWVTMIDENGNPYEVSEKNSYYRVFEQKNRSREEWLHDLFFNGNCFCNPSSLIRNKKNLHAEMYGICGIWQLPDYFAWISLLFKANLYVLEDRLTFFRLRREKQENTSAERPDTVIRSEMELYRVLKKFRQISDVEEFLKIFPEAESYVVNGDILIQYAFAKILQTCEGAARKLLALDILFDLINDKKTSKKLFDLYNYTEINFVKENSEFGILYPETKLRYSETSLYYDTGEGFSEADRKISQTYVKRDGEFLAEFSLDLKNNIQALRFDPTEDEAVAVKIISLQINGQDVDFKPYPPFVEKDGYQVFFTSDPKYILNYSGSGKISAKIFGKISAEYDSLNILNDENFFLRDAKAKISEELKISNQKLSDAVEQKNFLIGELDSQNKYLRHLEDRVNEQTNKIGGLEWQLNEIYSSRGYKLLQKYYSLRDSILPLGSTRRLLVKNFAWAILNPGRALSLINLDNLKKAWFAWKHGGLRQLVVRSDTKINSAAVTEIKNSGSVEFGNIWLEKRENFSVPADIVVDILVPIYNAYDFTKKCIETVFENTDVDFNLYLIDDCSTDERISKLLEEVRQKKKPSHLRDLKILHNEKNLGFIGSVNRGFELSKNNVVLLNTDTEVPPNWLSRLVRPLLEDKNIASVTPFTNSGEICSFPNICENNDLIPNLTVAQVDEIFSRYGAQETFDMPTGIGFCMLMRRECLDKFGTFDTIFGKGYGEENDWCRRVAEKGYRNVHVRDLFVWHKHGASFAERHDKTKQERLQENLAILSERYPDYHKIVQDYIQKDPAGANRKFLQHCVNAKANENIEGIIFLNHSMGGGAKIYQDNLISEWIKNRRVYGMLPLADGKTLSVKFFSTEGEEKVADFNIKTFSSENFSALMDALKINSIFVNHTLTFPMPKTLNWIIESKIPYIFFGHDFYAVCPSYQLLNSDLKYCGAQTDPVKCSECLKKNVLPFSKVDNVDIVDWRKNFQTFLDGAEEIIVPSKDTEKIFHKYYSTPIISREHKVSKFLTNTFKNEFANEENLTVAVIGAIGDEKGSKIVYSLAETIDKSSLPIQLLVIGITNLHNAPYISPSGKFKITGKYDNKEISNLLAKNKVAIVLIPSIWPETYSYTTTEAMASGYPVMVFPLGAPADRVKETGGGWILENVSDQAIIKKLETLLGDRENIISTAEKLKSMNRD